MFGERGEGPDDGADSAADREAPDEAAVPEEPLGDFGKLLESSLKGKSADAIMRAKKERGAPPPVPLRKRLKRYPPPEATLDLHGFTADNAGARAETWIRTAAKKGLFTLRIVVGRGVHSEFGAVLPDVAEDLLVRLKKEAVVLTFEWEKKKKKSSGAVIVYLKQFSD